MAVDYEMEALEKEVEELNKKHFSQETPEKEDVEEQETTVDEAVKLENAGTEEIEVVEAPEKAEGSGEAKTDNEPVNIYEKRYNDLRPWTTRVSQENAALKAELASMRRYLEAVKSDLPKPEDALSEAMAPVKEEYDELADVIGPAIDKVVKNYISPLQAELNLLRQKAVKGDNEAFEQAVRADHPHFDEDVQSVEFNEWLGRDSQYLPARIKVEMFQDRSNDPQVAIKLLNAYHAEIDNQKTTKKESHERAVRQAAQAMAEPKAGGSNPHTLAMTDKKSKFGTLADVVNMDNDYYEKHAAEILADINAGILR